MIPREGQGGGGGGGGRRGEERKMGKGLHAREPGGDGMWTKEKMFCGVEEDERDGVGGGGGGGEL